MTQLDQELLEIADTLEQLASSTETASAQTTLTNLLDVCREVGKSWSGSWLGYHAHIYYERFTPPLPGDHFDPEWGFAASWPIQGTTGPWTEYTDDDVLKEILGRAGGPDLKALAAIAESARLAFESAKAGAQSVMSATETALDEYGSKLAARLSELETSDSATIMNRLIPKGNLVSRDSKAVYQGLIVPKHIEILAGAAANLDQIEECKALAEILRRLGSHLVRISKRESRNKRVGTNVFIGHGRSLLWRELKDFINDRLHLPWDEFNRVPVAGVTNTQRLSEMLDAAAIAILVMTGEDETTEGVVLARQNVVHEAGLFQGRLGFSRAIVLLEEGVEEFSNIQGLGQIHFPKGRIRAAFEEVRLVLEREGLVA